MLSNWSEICVRPDPTPQEFIDLLLKDGLEQPIQIEGLLSINTAREETSRESNPHILLLDPACFVVVGIFPNSKRAPVLS
jgi:hypothetical protein